VEVDREGVSHTDCLFGTLISSSKKILALLGVGFRLGDGVMRARPCVGNGAMTVRVI
jgi:hypothetical protein